MDPGADEMKAAQLRTLEEIFAIIAASAARDRQAREQGEAIDRMCRETGYSISALCREAGMSNATITRYRKLGRPNKPETISRLACAYSRILARADKLEAMR
jgi:transposase-like protein